MRARGLLLSAALLVACVTKSAAPTVEDRSALEEIAEPAPAAPPSFRLFLTGDTRGFFEPCGCEERQRGGIARRKGYLDAVARPGDLRIDLGNAAAGTREERDLRLRTSLRALGGMRYDVFVPGRAEFLAPAWPAVIGTLAAESGPRVVCANSGHPLAADPRCPASIVHALPDGRRVGIVGVTESPASVGAGPRPEPLEAARAEVTSLAGRVDAIVVAAAVSWRDARALADELDGVALVVAGRGPDDPTDDRGGTRIPLVATGPRGEHVLRVDFDASLRPVRAWRAWLDEGLPEDAAMQALAKEHRRAMSDLDPNFVPDIVVGLRARGFAGTAACAECHAEDHEVWKGSKHAHAMATLVAKEAERDPECVPCHLADVSVEPPLPPADLGVGCEACHGGSLKHVESARRGERPVAKTPYQAELASCAGCHRPPEVTRFDVREAWKRIVHGQK